jgi:ATP-dependent DNA helicase RecG
MAPTEILARQHHKTIAPLAAAAGVEIALLTGRDKGKARQQIVEGLESGERVVTAGAFELAKLDPEIFDKTKVKIAPPKEEPDDEK